MHRGYIWKLLPLLAICLCLAGCNRGGSTGNPVSEFRFRTTAGSIGSTADYLGKPLVVNFWADW
ncbi:hypothetical protein KDL44_03200 [bacterium]|nr:hypothetical protein [bacterium]